MSFTISFNELWTYSSADTERRLPLSSLPEDGAAHVHGRLEILVAGKALPYLGFWGPSDVCFGEWLPELRAAVRALNASATSEYTYDEGEQGQPAFQWTRRGSLLLVSVVDSVLSDGRAHPDWQRVECRYEDFVDQVEKFEREFSGALLQESPIGGAAWLRDHKRGAA